MDSQELAVSRRGGLKPLDLEMVQKRIGELPKADQEHIQSQYTGSPPLDGCHKLNYLMDRVVDDSFCSTIDALLENAPKGSTYSQTQHNQAVALFYYAFTEHRISDFPVSHAAELMDRFSLLGDFESSQRVWEEDPRLHSSIQLRERYAHALIHGPDVRAKDAFHQGTAITKIEPDNPEGYYIMGRALEEAGLLSAAVEPYGQAFDLKFDTHHGLQYLTALLRAGRRDEAHDVACLLEIAYIADGGADGHDHTTVLAAYAGAMVRGHVKELDELAEQLLAVDDELWEMKESLRKLALIQQGLGGDNQHISQLQKKLQHRVNVAENEGLNETQIADLASKEVRARLQKDPVAGHLRLNSWSYRGGVHYHVSGSFPYGAIPAHAVNRQDWQLMRHYMDQPIRELINPDQLTEEQVRDIQGIDLNQRLIDLASDEEYLTISSVLVRQIFRTDLLQLEKITSPGHAVHDRGAQARLGLARELQAMVKKVPDVRTNITATMADRHGDCRQHTWTHQLMWDVRQRHRVTHQIRDAKRALAVGNRAGFEQDVAKAKQIMQTEMRSFDVHIHAPIKMKEAFDPHRLDGVPLLSEKLELFEYHHQMTAVLVYSEEGQLEKMLYRDPFYRGGDNWHLGKSELSADQLKGYKQGEMLPVPTTVKVMNPTSGETQQEPFYLEPSQFSMTNRTRDAREDKIRKYGIEESPDLKQTLNAKARAEQDHALLNPRVDLLSRERNQWASEYKRFD